MAGELVGLEVLIPLGLLLVILLVIFGYILCKHYLWGGLTQDGDGQFHSSKYPIISCAITPPPISYHKIQVEKTDQFTIFNSFRAPLFLAPPKEKFGDLLINENQSTSTDGLDDNKMFLVERDWDSLKYESEGTLLSETSDSSDFTSPRKRSSTLSEKPYRGKHKRHKKRNQSEPFIKTISFDDLSSLSPVQRGRSGSYAMQLETPASGQLDFDIFYNNIKKTLEITVVQLQNVQLDPHSFIGVLDTYQQSDKPSKREKAYLLCDEYSELKLVNNEEVEYFIYITLLPRKAVRKYTKSILGHNTVTFNEKISITGYSLDYINGLSLCFHALCKFGKEDKPIIIGEVKQPLTDINSSTILTFTPFLNRPEEALHLESSLTTSTDLGYLEIVMFYDAMPQILTVTIVEARGLPKYGFTGKSNISIKVGLYLYCNLIEKKKSKSVRRRNPEFNETFTFNIDREKQPDFDLLFELRHHGPLYKKHIGYVTVGYSAGSEGKQHWTELLDFHRHTKQHKIMPYKPLNLL